MEYFSDKVDQLDPTGIFTDFFFCDGVANVQKAGAILCVKYPSSMTFHGGEHLLSLFSDLAKIHPIQVSLKFLLNLLLISNIFSVIGSKNFQTL